MQKFKKGDLSSDPAEISHRFHTKRDIRNHVADPVRFREDMHDVGQNVFSGTEWWLVCSGRTVIQMRFDLTVQNQWIRGGTIAGVRFSVWQAVKVVAGPHEGKSGKLISLFDLAPEPVFQLETSHGEDLYARQSEMEPLDFVRRDLKSQDE